LRRTCTGACRSGASRTVGTSEPRLSLRPSNAEMYTGTTRAGNMFARGKQLYGLRSPDPARRRPLPRTCTRVRSPPGTSAVKPARSPGIATRTTSPRTPFRHRINQRRQSEIRRADKRARGAKRGHSGEASRETVLRTGSLPPRRRTSAVAGTAALVGGRPRAELSGPRFAARDTAQDSWMQNSCLPSALSICSLASG
jgi:hypothetical protein